MAHPSGAGDRGRGQVPGILSLAWPLVVSFALRAAFTWVDRVYAAFLPDPDVAQAAIGLAQPIEFLLIAAWVGSSNALTSRYAAAMGAGEGRRMLQLVGAARVLIRWLVLLFLLVGAAIWFSAPGLGLAPELARGFQLYGTALIGGSALTAFWSIVPDSIVKAHQDTRTTMWAGIVSSLVNVALNTLFVFVFEWGLVGIGLSTALGRLGGLAFAAWRAAEHESARRAADRDHAPGTFPRPLAALLGIAIPSGLTYVLLAVEGLLVNGILAHSHGQLGLDPAARATAQADALAAWSVFSAAISMLAMPAIATGVAVLPLAARLSGTGQLSRMRRELLTAIAAFAVYLLAAVAPALWLGWSPLCRALLGAQRPIALAELAGPFVFAAVAMLGPFMVVRPLFDALARSDLGLRMSALRSLGAIVPGTWLGGWIATRSGVDPMLGYYWGYAVGLVLGSGLAGRRAWRVLAERS